MWQPFTCGGKARNKQRAQAGTSKIKSLMLTGVSWFEVDRSDVLRAKHKALKKAGAAFSQSENQTGTTPSVSVHSLTIAMLQLGAACLPNRWEPAQPTGAAVLSVTHGLHEGCLACRHKVPAEGSIVHQLLGGLGEPAVG